MYMDCLVIHIEAGVTGNVSRL